MIETIPKVGYRLAVPQRRMTAGPARTSRTTLGALRTGE